jgi:RNA polymerase sigma-70 factor (ECF subfamily)
MNIKHLEDIFVKEISGNNGIIHKVCNIYCNNPEEKKDLMQEITLQLWKSFPNFKQKSKFSTWMYKIALNTAITNIRKSNKNPIQEYLSEKKDTPVEKEDIPDLDDEINRLYKAIAKLNEVEKGIILLYLEKKTYAEIGEITGLSEKNISVKIVRIKSKLKKLLT